MFVCLVLACAQPLLASARAAWARYCRDSDAACSALLEAHNWGAAHELLVRRVAPAMIMANRWGCFGLCNVVPDSCAAMPAAMRLLLLPRLLRGASVGTGAGCCLVHPGPAAHAAGLTMGCAAT